MGEAMVEAWIDWVARGHHGDNPSNLSPTRKWRGLGQRSGPASLYAMAKRLDSQWRKQLPQHLWFGGNNNQEIFETFLASSIKCAPSYLFRRS